LIVTGNSFLPQGDLKVMLNWPGVLPMEAMVNLKAALLVASASIKGSRKMMMWDQSGVVASMSPVCPSRRAMSVAPPPLLTASASASSESVQETMGGAATRRLRVVRAALVSRAGLPTEGVGSDDKGGEKDSAVAICSGVDDGLDSNGGSVAGTGVVTSAGEAAGVGVRIGSGVRADVEFCAGVEGPALSASGDGAGAIVARVALIDVGGGFVSGCGGGASVASLAFVVAGAVSGVAELAGATMDGEAIASLAGKSVGV